MLNPEIREFIEMIQELKVVGCILVPETSQTQLLERLKQADRIVGMDSQGGRVTFYAIRKEMPWPKVDVPGLIIVNEEEYSNSTDFQEQVRDKAGYFLNVR